jgi:hypothetical protein
MKQGRISKGDGGIDSINKNITKVANNKKVPNTSSASEGPRLVWAQRSQTLIPHSKGPSGIGNVTSYGLRGRHSRPVCPMCGLGKAPDRLLPR